MKDYEGMYARSVCVFGVWGEGGHAVAGLGVSVKCQNAGAVVGTLLCAYEHRKKNMNC